MKILNEIWAIIPARSGSKSLKNKNIKIFLGKPLIAHSLISAKNNNLIDKVIFSSDSNKYISIAKKYKCDYYNKRSEKNSRDKSTDYDVFKEIVTFFIKKKVSLPKFLIHFRPTCPIRNDITITKAIQIFKKKHKSYSSLKSVSLNSHNSLKDYFIRKNQLFSINKKINSDIDKVNIPRNNLEKTYIGNNVVDIYKTENILKKNLLGNQVYPFLTNEIFFDIDSQKDFKIAEIIARLSLRS
jgi:CMP-N,N'-diacetyllegionaminic acid synthase